MRPRQSRPDLPTGVYFRHGAYYRVVKGRWHWLGHTLGADPALDTRAPTRRAVLEYTRRVIVRARSNASGRRGLAFELTADDAQRMLDAADWRCKVTKTPFSLEVVAGKRPFAPSVDRINSAIGYTRDNCRVVCVATNYAMNVWGEQVLWRMLRNLRRSRKVLDMSKTSA